MYQELQNQKENRPAGNAPDHSHTSSSHAVLHGHRAQGSSHVPSFFPLFPSAHYHAWHTVSCFHKKLCYEHTCLLKPRPQQPQGRNNPSFHPWRNTQNVVYPCDGILLSHEKGQVVGTWRNLRDLVLSETSLAQRSYNCIDKKYPEEASPERQNLQPGSFQRPGKEGTGKDYFMGMRFPSKGRKRFGAGNGACPT